MLEKTRDPRGVPSRDPALRGPTGAGIAASGLARRVAKRTLAYPARSSWTQCRRLLYGRVSRRVLAPAQWAESRTARYPLPQWARDSRGHRELSRPGRAPAFLPALLPVVAGGARRSLRR